MEYNKFLLSGEALEKEKKLREKKYDIRTIKNSLINEYLLKGWSIDRKFKKTIRLKKEIEYTSKEAFENKLWLLFYKLGFTTMNKGRLLKIPYSNISEELDHNIDIFAADDETIILIECRSSDNIDKQTSFQNDIELLKERKDGIIKSLKKLFSNKKLKIKFIFATNNYGVSNEDKQILKQYGISHFDEDTIDYYYHLYEYLGLAARYQLLGNLFSGQKIHEMNNIVPAIEGYMGKHKYLFFFY